MDNGSQGSIKEVKYRGIDAIEKRSCYVDFVIELESMVMKKAAELNTPHFCKYLTTKWINDKSVFLANKINGLIIRNIRCCDKVNKQDLLSQYPHEDDFEDKNSWETISNSNSDTTSDDDDDNDYDDKYIPYIRMEPEEFMDCVYQTMCAISLLNEKVGIAHNDLHTANVMIETTDIDLHIYDFGNNETYEILTHGYRPVIIDFGYSFIPNEPICHPTCFTDIGYDPYEIDNLSDARIFTTGISRMIKREILPYIKGDGITSYDIINKFERYVQFMESLWKPLNLHHGWFRSGTFPNLIDTVKNTLYIEPGLGFLPSSISSTIFVKGNNAIEDTIDMFISRVQRPIIKSEPIDLSLEESSELKRLINKFRNINSEFLIATVVYSTFVRKFIKFRNITTFNDRDQLVFLKYLFVLSPVTICNKYSLDYTLVVALQKSALRVVSAIQTICYFIGEETKYKKMDIYTKCYPIKSMRDILRSLEVNKIKIPRFKGMKIITFDCVGLNHKTEIIH